MALINQKVVANMAMDEFLSKSVMLNLAMEEGTLAGSASVGNQVSFAMYTYGGDATAVTRGTEITGDDLANTEVLASVEQMGKSYLIYDVDVYTTVNGGGHADEASRQVGQALARAFDTSLVDKAKAGTTVFRPASGTAITQAELLSAINELGDQQDIEDLEGIVLHSTFLPSLYSMPLFINSQNTTATALNGIVRNGFVGQFKGIDVYVSDKGTFETTNNEGYGFVVRRGALKYRTSKAVQIEEERQATYKRTAIVGDIIFATAVADQDGLVVIKRTAE